jgi:hypothetical protein
MAKKIWNINAMRPVIIKAHGADYCNSKAITKEMVIGAGVDMSYFLRWQNDVNALRETVCEYIKLKHDTTAKDEEVYAARERIFPKWKSILEAGENTKEERELHVTPYDIDSLVGYAEQFMATSRGTIITYTTKQIFRKYVEALLGCRIAQNAVMTDSDRETLQTYYSAQRRIQNCIDIASDLKTKKEAFNLMKDDAKNEPAFLKFIERKIREIEEQERVNIDNRSKADETLTKVAEKAKIIEARIKTIK